VLLLLLLLGVLLPAGQGCGALFRDQTGPDNGDVDMTFTATEMFTGETYSFPADFEGSVVYLLFFADG
jgi:hypothetical protein